MDYGVPGDSDQPDVVRHVREVETAAARAGTIMGAFAGNADTARRYLEAGYRYLAVGGDISFLSGAARTCVSQLQALLAEIAAT